MADDEVSRTTISMSPETRDRLKALGRKGETYDELLNRLIDDYIGIRDDRRPGHVGTSRAEGEVDFEEV